MVSPTCAECPLHGSQIAGPPVPGEGSWDRGILLLGMCPGADETRTGRPFCGPAGEILDGCLHEARIPRSSIRIENVLRCRPTTRTRVTRGRNKGKLTLKNRDPVAAEIQACSPRLIALIQHYRPRVIVPLGAVATRFIEDKPIPRISDRRGWAREIDRFGYTCVVLPTFHPAAVLHSGDTRQSAIISEDLAAAVEIAKSTGSIHDGKDWTARRIGTPEEFSDFVDTLIKAKRPFGLDVEHSPGKYEFNVYTIGICPLGGQRVYMPLYSTGQSGPKPLWPEEQRASILASFKRLMSSGLGVATHGGSTESHAVLALTGIELKDGWFDTHGAHHLCVDEDWGTQGLGHLHLQYPDLAGYKHMPNDYLGKEKLTGEDFGLVDTDVLGCYCAMDADTTMRLADQYAKLLRKDPPLGRIFWNVSIPALRMFSSIERTGVLLDLDICESVRDKWQAKLDEVLGRIQAVTSTKFNPGSFQQVAHLLYEQKGMPVLAYTKTGGNPSTDADVLERLYAETGDECLKDLIAYRSTKTVISTFLAKFPTIVDANNRLHCRYNVFGPSTGRPSSKDPNLQNIPHVPEIRRMFIAGPGRKLVTADYSQIELRILAAASQDQEMLKIFRTSDLDLHSETADILGISRPDAKTFNFALVYGAVAGTLAQRIGKPVSVAERMLEQWFARFHGVYEFIERTKIEARTQGYVRTMYGRYRRLPWINCGNVAKEREAERQAVNTKVQGPAATYGMRNQALLYDWVVANGLVARPVLQVHDEIVYETPDDEVEVLLAKMNEILVQPFAPLDVPILIDIIVSDSWEKP